jgi:hypothetical protein
MKLLVTAGADLEIATKGDNAETIVRRNLGNFPEEASELLLEMACVKHPREAEELGLDESNPPKKKKRLDRRYELPSLRFPSLLEHQFSYSSSVQSQAPYLRHAEQICAYERGDAVGPVLPAPGQVATPLLAAPIPSFDHNRSLNSESPANSDTGRGAPSQSFWSTVL